MIPGLPRRRGRPGHDLDTVLRTAVQLFIRRGYDYTSMLDVAAELGISKSSVYHHIESKEQLLELSINQALDALFAAADEVDALPLPAVERLEQLIRRSVLVLDDKFEFVSLLLRVRGNTATERLALLRRRDFDDRVTRLVKQAQAEGDIRADVDPATASRLLFGMVNSLTEWYQPGRGSPEALAATISALAFDGLRTR